MKKNLLALLLVILVCAVASQWSRRTDPYLQAKIEDGLERIWYTEDHQAEVTRDAQGLHIKVKARLSPAISHTQEQWNFPLLRFIVSCNGEKALPQISLSRADDQRIIQEDSSQPIAELEMARRQAQVWLDNNIGPGQALALVDALAEPIWDDTDPQDHAAYSQKVEREIPNKSTKTTFNYLMVVISPQAKWAEKKLTTMSLPDAMGFKSLGISTRIQFLH